jgi:hypothetical protein
VFSVLALIIALVCVAASAARLKRAILATPLDPAPLVEALRGDAGRARFEEVRAALKAEPEGTWERDLAAAFDHPEEVRAAEVNELLTELDFRLQSWARVPRVCASVAASSGLLLASLALRNGLSGAVADLPPEIQELAIGQAVREAVDVAALGICGAIFCIALGHHATKSAKVRLQEVDRLVERIEALAVPPERPPPENQK